MYNSFIFQILFINTIIIYQLKLRPVHIDTVHSAEHEFTCGVGFPDSSVGKESTCNAGEPRSIPGWG